MLRGIRGRLTYANVVASLALFIALGGASYAAVKLPKNSVGASQIKKNAITSVKVKDSSLTGADIKDRSLTAADFNGLVQGAVGPQGPAGAKGDTGAAGPVNGDLPSGATLRGVYASSAPSGLMSGAVFAHIGFGLRLSGEPTVHVVPLGGPKPAECQGTVYMPEAAPGHLCLYRQFENGLDAPFVCRVATAANPDSVGGTCGAANRMGVFLEFPPSGSGVHLAQGAWAVTGA